MDFPPNERDKNLKVIGIRIRPNQMWVNVQPRGTSLPQEQLFQRHSAVWPMIAGVKHVHMILIPHSQKGACVCEYLSATYLLLLFFFFFWFPCSIHEHWIIIIILSIHIIILHFKVQTGLSTQELSAKLIYSLSFINNIHLLYNNSFHLLPSKYIFFYITYKWDYMVVCCVIGCGFY